WRGRRDCGLLALSARLPASLTKKASAQKFAQILDPKFTIWAGMAGPPQNQRAGRAQRRPYTLHLGRLDPGIDRIAGIAVFLKLVAQCADADAEGGGRLRAIAAGLAERGPDRLFFQFLETQ